MTWALIARLLFLAFVASIVIVYVALVNLSQDHRDRLTANCQAHAVPGVARVEVRASDVAYARAQGWPRVLRVGGEPPLADPVAYDHGPAAGRVQHATGKFCRGQRYTLIVKG
jgi:hypothetical protein